MILRPQVNEQQYLTWLICITVFSIGGVATGAFTDVTSSVAPGLPSPKVAWGDYNNDGFVDMSVNGSVWHNNNGANFFRSTTASTGGDGTDGIWGDYDNDGWLDFFNYTRGIVHRSNNGISFSSMSIPSSGIAPNIRGASWGDHNNDSYLDLYVGGYESPYYSDVRLRNNGGTGFSNVWTQPTPRPGRGITSADFDRDGDIDIYVSNYRLEPNELHVNNGSGNFTDQAPARGATGGTGHTIGSAWGDMNNDGYLDLFVGNFSHPWDSQPGPQFLGNTGPGGGYSFQNNQEWAYGSGEWQESYASPTLGDYDNDGDLDLFFTTVYEVASYGTPNFPRLYRNDGNWNFTDVTASEGLSGISPTYQAAFADYDNDGDLDLVSHGRLFKNQAPAGNHWLKLKMIGDGETISRDAVGAQVRIQAGGKTFVRQVELGTGEGNQNDPTLHFGLGNITGPVDLDILWPGGTTRQVSDVAVDQLHNIYFVPPLVPYQWTATGGGSWHTDGNWSPAGEPNGNDHYVQLTGAATSTAIVDLLVARTVAGIEIDGSSDYRVVGHGTIAGLTLDSISDNTELNVLAGDHLFDLPVNAVIDTGINVSSGSSLTLDGPLDFAGVDVTKNGAGSLVIQGGTSSGSGTLEVTEGTLVASGEVDSDLLVTGGEFVPKDGIGRVDIKGDFALGPSGSMQLEVAGTASNNHDFLVINNIANLAGTLQIELLNGYRPDPGNQFLMMVANRIDNTGVTLGGASARYFEFSILGSSLLLTAVEVPGSEWTNSAGGNWHMTGNWSPSGVPDSTLVTARLTGSTAPVTNIQLDSDVTLREIVVDGSSTYQLTGSGSLNLDGQLQQADIVVTGGDHTWEVDLFANANTTVAVAAGASVSLNGTFDFDNVTVVKQGEGILYLDDNTNSGSGTLEVNGGTLAGSGDVNGDLLVSSGIVAPGHGIGTLDVRGDFTLESQATLQIDIEGPSLKDTLIVLGDVDLAGSLEVVLDGGYQPALGTQFLVIIASSVTDNGLTLTGANADEFEANFYGNSLILTSLFAGLEGDYNEDGIVDAADYTLWRDTRGENVLAGSGADGNRDGMVNQADYVFWKTRFGNALAGGSSQLVEVPEPAGQQLLWLVLTMAAAMARQGPLATGRRIRPHSCRG
jgi:autotransporter-associated beta strand protein